MTRSQRLLPLFLSFGSIAALFAIGLHWNLFGHDIDWHRPATWGFFACIPAGIFGCGWFFGGFHTGLRWATITALLLAGAALIGMLRN